MFKGKILSGCWEEGTIELLGMPQEFMLSSRSLAVLELNEYDTLETKARLSKDLVDCIDNLINNKAHMPSVEALLKEAKEIKC